MSTDISNTVFQTLESKGLIGEVRAKLQSSIYQIVDNQTANIKKNLNFTYESPVAAKLKEIPEGALVLNAIYDFLASLRFDYTLEVFKNECNLKQAPERKELVDKFGLGPDAMKSKLPALVFLVKDKGKSTISGTTTPISMSKTIPSPSTFTAATPANPPPTTAATGGSKLGPLNPNPLGTPPPNKLPGAPKGTLPAYNSNAYDFDLGGGGAKKDPYDFDLGGGAKKDPYAFDIGGDTKKDPYDFDIGGGSKKKEPEPITKPALAPTSKMNPFAKKEEKHEEKLDLKSTTKTTTASTGKSSGLLGDLPSLGGKKDTKPKDDYEDDIFEEIVDEDPMINSERNKFQESDEFNASQSQGIDQTVSSHEMKNYDYFEEIK